MISRKLSRRCFTHICRTAPRAATMPRRPRRSCVRCVVLEWWRIRRLSSKLRLVSVRGRLHCEKDRCNSGSGLHLLYRSRCHLPDRHSCTRWRSAWPCQCILTLLNSRLACSSFGCCHLFVRPYVCSQRLVRIEVLHDTAIGGAFDSVLGRACSCGGLIESRNAENSTQGCNGYRSTGDPDLGSLFCFQPGPFPTCFRRISQYHAGSALVWLNVWRLHRGFFPCPRIYVWGRKTASNAGLGLGDCCLLHP